MGKQSDIDQTILVHQLNDNSQHAEINNCIVYEGTVHISRFDGELNAQWRALMVRRWPKYTV